MVRNIKSNRRMPRVNRKGSNYILFRIRIQNVHKFHSLWAPSPEVINNFLSINIKVSVNVLHSKVVQSILAHQISKYIFKRRNIDMDNSQLQVGTGKVAKI